MLHTVNKSPFDKGTLKSCLATAQENDPILLIEDGVLAAMTGTVVEGMVKEALEHHPIYALEPDLKARGIESVIDGIQVCGYDRFVELAAEQPMFAWL